MKLERFTWKLAMVWASFRMVADIAHQLLNGILNLVSAAASLALLGVGAWWLWKVIGHQLPI